MRIVFKSQALDDLAFFEKKHRRLAERIYSLLKSIETTPFLGLGKPEPLKYQLSGKWSRRIDYTHRLVYGVSGDTITVYSCRFHY